MRALIGQKPIACCLFTGKLKEKLNIFLSWKIAATRVALVLA